MLGSAGPPFLDVRGWREMEGFCWMGGKRLDGGGGMDAVCLHMKKADGRCLDGGGWMEGWMEWLFDVGCQFSGSRFFAVRRAGLQGWTVPGGSVSVCGLPANCWTVAAKNLLPKLCC